MKKEIIARINNGVSFVIDLRDEACDTGLYPIQIYTVPYRYKYHADTWYIDMDDLLDIITEGNKHEVTWSDVKAVWECDSHSDANMWATALRFTRGLQKRLYCSIDVTACKATLSVCTTPIEYIEYLESIKGAAQ